MSLSARVCHVPTACVRGACVRVYKAGRGRQGIISMQHPISVARPHPPCPILSPCAERGLGLATLTVSHRRLGPHLGALDKPSRPVAPLASFVVVCSRYVRAWRAGSQWNPRPLRIEPAPQQALQRLRPLRTSAAAGESARGLAQKPTAALDASAPVWPVSCPSSANHPVARSPAAYSTAPLLPVPTGKGRCRCEEPVC